MSIYLTRYTNFLGQIVRYFIFIEVIYRIINLLFLKLVAELVIYTK